MATETPTFANVAERGQIRLQTVRNLPGFSAKTRVSHPKPGPVPRFSVQNLAPLRKTTLSPGAYRGGALCSNRRQGGAFADIARTADSLFVGSLATLSS